MQILDEDKDLEVRIDHRFYVVTGLHHAQEA